MPTDNDWLRRIHDLLGTGSGPGGITQAQMTAAINQSFLNEPGSLLDVLIYRQSVTDAVDASLRLSEMINLLQGLQNGIDEILLALPQLSSAAAGCLRFLNSSSPEYDSGSSSYRQFKVPTGKEWRLQSLSARMTSSPSQSRQLILLVGPDQNFGSGGFSECFVAPLQPPGKEYRYSFSGAASSLSVLPFLSADAIVQVQISHCWLLPEFVVRLTDSTEVGGSISNMSLLVEERNVVPCASSGGS